MPTDHQQPSASAHDLPPVVTGRKSLAQLDKWLAKAAAQARLFVLGDETTMTDCLPELLAQIPRLQGAEHIQVRSGERSKDLEVCRALWTHLAERHADRNTVLINLGGGVITDLGGFVAATYKRGIRFVHVPTTLMGMVDASIGGKSGIDLLGIKNLVGAFAFPEAVYIHPPFLRTLGKRDILNGAAEMLKHGLALDADHWNAMRNAPLHDLDALPPLIQRSAELKLSVVQADPYEQGPRRVLNLGHTIGHALEAFALESSQRSLLHGEAVAIGLICATWLSWRRGLLERPGTDEVIDFLLELYPPFHLDSADHHRILALMRNDKKNTGEAYRFTLLTGIGSARTGVAVDASQVIEALDHYRLLTAHAATHQDP